MEVDLELSKLQVVSKVLGQHTQTSGIILILLLLNYEWELKKSQPVHINGNQLILKKEDKPVDLEDQQKT